MARTLLSSNNFEQRIQTVIQVAMCSVLVWGGNSLLSVREGLATLQATSVLTNSQTAKEISDLKLGLESLKAKVDNSITAAAAKETAAAIIATATAAALALSEKKGGK